MDLKEKIEILIVNKYFLNKVKKCYVDRVNYLGVQTFEQLLSYRYRDFCYYYSTYALMGLNNDDKLVRGYVALNSNQSNYDHGWVEFSFNDKEYVFDSMVDGIVTKEEWYTDRKPRITCEFSKEEILKMYLTEEKSNLLKDGKTYQVNDEIDNNDKTYITNPMRLATIKMGNKKVKRFIAYDEPSG